MVTKNCLFALLLVTMFSAPAHAAVVDFETTTGGAAPADNQAVLGSFADGATNVTFGFDTTNNGAIDVNARFEDRTNGDDRPLVAYTVNNPGINPDLDLTATNEGGDWLLREPKNPESPTASLAAGDSFLIVYSGVLPTSASGQIWDIDGNELFKVEAFDSTGTLLSTINPPQGGLPGPGSLNGVPFTFVFDSLSSPIAEIAITLPFVTIGGGFAFDNFNATAIPEPATSSLFLLGAVLALRRRRR